MGAARPSTSGVLQQQPLRWTTTTGNANNNPEGGQRPGRCQQSIQDLRQPPPLAGYSVGAMQNGNSEKGEAQMVSGAPSSGLPLYRPQVTETRHRRPMRSEASAVMLGLSPMSEQAEISDGQIQDSLRALRRQSLGGRLDKAALVGSPSVPAFAMELMELRREEVASGIPTLHDNSFEASSWENSPW